MTSKRQRHTYISDTGNTFMDLQQVLDMKDLFGTLANCTVSIYIFVNFYCKKMTQVEVGYGLLNVS